MTNKLYFVAYGKIGKEAQQGSQNSNWSQQATNLLTPRWFNFNNPTSSLWTHLEDSNRWGKVH